jgi:histidinol phosphatase-like PHP family hydrolase
LKSFNYNQIGYFKYKSTIPTIVDCVREYPITEFILDKIKKNELVWEIESERQKPKLHNGKLIVLI